MKKILLISLTTLLSFKGFAAAIYLPEFCDPLVWQTTQELRAALIGEDLREEAPEDAFAEANPEEVNPDFAGFVARGGHIHIVGDDFSRDHEGPWSKSFVLRAGDLLIPVCHAGQNRSQAMNMVLHDLAPEGVEILAPHGALSGFDPYQGYENLTMDNFFQYVFGPFDKRENSLMIKQTEVLLKLLGSPSKLVVAPIYIKALEAPS